MVFKILVVDDEKPIVQLIQTYLVRAGYQVLTAYNGQEALDLAASENPDLVVLDLMLPEISGEDVCEYLRDNSSIPIIMLTAKTDEDQKVLGLTLGADDYITKPFSPKELVARVKAVLRRTQEKQDEVVQSIDGAILLEPHKHSASINQNTLTLTPTEYKLLHVMLTNPQRVFTRTELAKKAFGWDYQGYEESIYVHVKNLRQKMKQYSKKNYITTVYGVGYRWDDHDAR